MIHAFYHADTLTNQSWYFLLDVESGSIHTLDKAAFDVAYALENNKDPYQSSQDAAAVDEILAEFEELKREGMFNVPLKAQPALYKNDQVIKAMCLHVAHDCNLRCEYCTYSGRYYTRTHSPERMSEDLAFEAIDFLVKHSKERKSVVVGFYGGEPLLEFDLIRKVVEYTENFYAEKIFQFTITTNGVLLSEDVVAYLKSKNFNLMISLDGPKELHNKYRRFSDEKGSFDLIYENLKNAKNNHREYFQVLKTNTVLTPGQDFDDIINFFRNDSLLRNVDSWFSMLSDMDSKEPIDFGDSFLVLYQKEHFKLMLYLLGELERSYISEAFMRYLNELTDAYKVHLSKTKMPVKAHPSGPCVAGVNKLFVDVNGDFYPCERVGENSAIKIGSLNEGYNIEMVRMLTNIGSISEEECLNCWAFRYCNMCVGKCLEQGEISKTKKMSHCQSVQYNAREKLQDIQFLKDSGIDFEKLSEVYDMMGESR